jgi:symplekin
MNVCSLFQTYSKMETTVQETLREIIIRPIHAIGPNNPKLLGYLKEYSETADSFVLGILNAFTDGNRPPQSIVSLVKTLLAEKGADARFLMLIIGEMDKVGHV